MNVVRLLTILLIITSTCYAESNELTYHQQLINDTRNTIIQKRFDVLDTAYQLYRDRNSRTPSGLWNLSIFYNGLQSLSETKQQYSESSFDQREKLLLEWLKASPKSPAPYIAYSNLLINHGWYYRGNKYANEVSSEAWVGFNKYIEKARNVLEKNKLIASQDPEWYATMLIVAKAQGWSRQDFDGLFAEAIKSEPNYYATYFNALEYLFPKWHGSIDKIDQFVHQAVNTTKSTEGVSMYARMYWVASQGAYTRDIFTSTRANWTEMKAGFDDIILRYPDAWNLNNYAYFACVAGDKAKTKELIKRIGKNVIPQAWPVAEQYDPLSYFSYCQQIAASP